MIFTYLTRKNTVPHCLNGILHVNRQQSGTLLVDGNSRISIVRVNALKIVQRSNQNGVLVRPCIQYLKRYANRYDFMKYKSEILRTYH